MARTKKRLVYIDPEVDEAIVARAEQMGISVNEWFNRCAQHYLVERKIPITITETKKVTP